jgi:PAT family beta-lactamase induction signal transducer AmpG
MGWGPFFLSTLVTGIPGLVMLQRFVPMGVREPVFTVEDVARKEPLDAAALAVRGTVGGVICGAFALLMVALLAAVKAFRAAKGSAGFDLAGAVWQVLTPVSIPDWIQLLGVLAFAVVGGLFVAAVSAARHGATAAVTGEAAAGE